MNCLTKFLTTEIKLTFVLLISMLFSSIAVAAKPLPLLSAEEQAVFSQRLKQALIDDPEILKAAIIALQKHEKNKQVKEQKDGIKSNYDNLFNNPNDPWMGAKSPKLTLVYFGDFNCGYCKKLEPFLTQLVEEYPEVKVVFKFVPILGETSKQAAELALTVWEKDQAKFTALREALINSRGPLSEPVLTKVTQSTSTQQWLDKTSDRAQSTVMDNLALMQEFGLTGTPSLIFADQIIGGFVPYNQLSQRIKAALAAE